MNKELSTKYFKYTPKDKWPYQLKNLISVLENRDFCVQIFDDNGFTRITISKKEYTLVDGKPIWEENITWDHLQEIKNEIGYADKWCVECFPPKDKVINVANMRHLWILENEPEFGWKSASTIS